MLTIVQMGGVLVLAAGVGPAFHGGFTIPVVGYVIMRVAMVAQWLRASRGAGRTRRTTLMHALGLSVVQVYWLAERGALGESLLASANAIIEALEDAGVLAPCIAIAVLTLVVTAAPWWICFWPPHHSAIGSLVLSAVILVAIVVVLVLRSPRSAETPLPGQTP
ncbi:hypothetical protein GCM10017576_31630 [Microbacterium barkeri]|uniref:Uncharacterized protein n=1 Tax=Microbacterium barkeri TaxID=33917 RepID=A0A9W6H5I5_9MICO|nr:low temperature requirement protein LtrA [Microbacterium barkeri]GLJ63032.1 hypothetical protein GCM10017576_31630 [Microbacterium barkeri]